MDPAWLKRAFALAELDCSGPDAKRQELETRADRRCQSPTPALNRQWSQPEIDLDGVQSGADPFRIPPQAILTSDLRPLDQELVLSANIQQDVEVVVLSERESSLQISETCFGMV
jgi:hypothetical protein